MWHPGLRLSDFGPKQVDIRVPHLGAQTRNELKALVIHGSEYCVVVSLSPYMLIRLEGSGAFRPNFLRLRPFYDKWGSGRRVRTFRVDGLGPRVYG